MSSKWLKGKGNEIYQYLINRIECNRMFSGHINEFIHATIWIKLENIMQSFKTQTVTCHNWTIWMQNIYKCVHSRFNCLNNSDDIIVK